jgi:hydroxymethyl cephem carbamoyltransferase
MLVIGLKPEHDGAIAAIRDNQLLFSIEPEKDSYNRHSGLTATALTRAAEVAGDLPDVIALGGWTYPHMNVGAGYLGSQQSFTRSTRFFGKPVQLFSSSHERSHVAMAIGMAEEDDAQLRAILVYEGGFGSFYLVDANGAIVKERLVIGELGARYGFLFALADPTFPDYGAGHRLEDSGKLMALAAYGDPAEASPEIVALVDRILEKDRRMHPAPKGDFRDTVVYNAGVESQECKTAAALLSDHIFEMFWEAAQRELPPGLPLHISGGCGLNCDWNAKWRDLGFFSSVFVPPCTDDSGSAIGTAIDALLALTGKPHIDWTVYSGLDFDWDVEPDRQKWKRRPLDHGALAEALQAGAIVGWVQGRWEIGPRALGNRSILAEPFDARTKDRLNEVKQREDYRPIAPCCRLEDAPLLFSDGHEDPYMLYFKRVLDDGLGAVTHVDGTARVQTVSERTNKPLYELLCAFAEQSGAGVLCNTSLNFKGFGFVNRMSNLVLFAESHGLTDLVVGDSWFTRSTEGKADSRLALAGATI